MTALMDAVRRNDEAAVAQLIAQGANVDEVDSGGNAPVVMAAYLGYAAILRRLLEAGASVAALDPDMKATALHAAAYAGHASTARLLIDYGIDMDRQGPVNGYTALHDAIWQNNIDVARLLIDAGANLTLKSRQGETPLMFAQAKRRAEIITLIERRQASS
jgi:ankyrin repeat protein